MRGTALLIIGLFAFGWARGEAMFEQLKGEYEVGFRLLEKWDSTRIYGDGFRPMQIAFWFPADKRSETALCLGDMIRMGARSETLVKNEKDADDQILGFLNSAHVDPEAAGEYLKRRLDVGKEAQIASGNFPLILYAPGSSAHWYDNYLLCQILASHGYIVVAMKSRSQKSPTMSANWLGVTAQVRDLEFALSQLYGMLGSERISGVNVVGRSWGAIAALVFAIENERITRSIASLDGTLSYNAHLLMEDSPYPGADYVRKPLFLAVGKKRAEGATPIDRKRYFEDVSYADVYQVEYDHMRHTAFGSYYLYYHFLLNKGIDKESVELLKEGFAEYTRHLLKFLDYYNGKSQERLIAMEAEGFSIDMKLRERQPLIDYQDFGYAMEVQGLPAAKDLYLKTKELDSTYAREELFSAGHMNGMAYRYLNMDRPEDAIVLLQIALDAFPENSNLHDSLGEMYFQQKDYENASRHYRESLRLDGSNQNAAQMLEEISRITGG